MIFHYLELKTDNNKYCRNKINETEIKLEELELEKSIPVKHNIALCYCVLQVRSMVILFKSFIYCSFIVVKRC